MKQLLKLTPYLAGIICAFALFLLASPTSTYAKDGSCWSGANSAMQAACDSDVEYGAGAAWINGEQNYNLSTETVIDDPDASSAPLYLHGALWNAASAYWYDAEIWAVNVKLCTGLSYSNWDIHNSWSNQCDGKSKPSYIKSYDSSFFRGYAKWGWSTGQGSYSGRINIDLKAFKAAASHTTDHGYDVYTTKVWVARCANTNGSSSCASSYAADESTIIIRIKKAQFISKSTISVTQAGGKTKTVDSGYSKQGSDEIKSNSKEYTFSGGSNIFTFKTTNTIKRVSDSSKNTIKAQYRRYTHSDATHATYGDYATQGLKSGKEYTVPDATDQAILKSIEIKPGEFKTVCTKIKLWRSTSINNGVSSFSDPLTPTSQACVTVKHKAAAKFRSKSELKITYNGIEVFNKGSGWNKTDKTNLKLVIPNAKVGDSITFTANNVINRSDSNDGWASAPAKYRKWNYDSKAFNSAETSPDIKTEKDFVIPTNAVYTGPRTVQIKKGGTKVCARIALSRSTTITGDGTTEYADITKPNSMICVTVSVTPIKDPEVDMGFIGETTKISGGSGYGAYASFFVDSSVLRGGFNASSSGETSPHYTYDSGWVRQSSMADPGDKKKLLYDGTNSLLGLYSGVRKSGSATQAKESNSFTIDVPDDTSYTGAKICVAGVKNRTPEYTVSSRTIYVSQTCSRQGADGTEYYDCSYSYKEYRHVFKYYWDYSAPACKPIAQKPSFQVRGNTLYSVGDITGIVASKTTGRHYSSWSEYLTVANGTVSRYGSGAAYRNKGADNDSDDINQKLTVANNASSKGSASIDSASESFISNIKSMFTKDGEGKEGKDTSNFHSVVLSGGTTINKAILDSNNISAASGKQNIIIATGDLSIDPSVSRIDAWLIVEGTLNTCSSVSTAIDLSTDKACNNNFLTVNGLVYAKEFKLLRTNVGVESESSKSAETVDLPASSYVHSYNEAVSRAKEPTAVYTQELAPRI